MMDVLVSQYIRLAKDLVGDEHGGQQRAAKQLGIGPAYLCAILNGKREPGQRIMKRAAKRVGISPATTKISGQPLRLRAQPERHKAPARASHALSKQPATTSPRRGRAGW